MSINAIFDAIKSLAVSLQVATIFPASLLVMVNVFFLLPRLSVGFEPDCSNRIFLSIALSLLISYLLYAFNFPLIRLFEGYRFKGDPIREWLVYNRQKWHQYIMNEIRRLENERWTLENRPMKPTVLANDPKLRDVNYRLAQLKREIERDYPSNIKAVLPTGLGNTIAAFEDYPRTRYGMETIALWPRLIPVLKERDYIGFITQEKTTFDFLLNTCIVVALLGVEIVMILVFAGRIEWALFTTAVTLVAVLIVYNGMIIAARQWGLAVRTAFDLHRYELHQRLRLRAVANESFESEFHRWQRISQFLLTRTNSIQFKYFLSQSEVQLQNDRANVTDQQGEAK